MTTVYEKKMTISYVGTLAMMPPEGTLLVENNEDYVRACDALARSLNTDGDLDVWVRSRNHYTWLRDFAEQIRWAGRFEEKTPCLVLSELWNADVPDWLTDDDVLEGGLLDLEIDAKERMSFTDRLLSHFLGGVFRTKLLGSGNLAEVIGALVSNDSKKAFQEFPLMQRCLEERCDEWAHNSDESWVEDICRYLPDRSGEVWQWLSIWAVLHGYPEKLLEFVLPPKQAGMIRKVPVEAIEDLPMEPTARDQVITQIELLYEEIKDEITTSEEYRQVVGWASGRLPREFRFVSSLLKGGRFSPTMEDVQKAQDQFRSCPGVSVSQLKALVHCVRPERPSLIDPDEEWTARDWIHWVRNEYIPYRDWQVHNGYYDPELEKTVERFSEWYVAEYTAIHQDPSLSLVHCLNDLASNEREKEISIILLIDCLPLQFMDILDDTFRQAGLSRREYGCRFAALPTTTEFNKPALLSGEWRDSPENYENILADRSASDWHDRKVLYLPNLKALAEMAVPTEPMIVLLNFRDSDELLHSDVKARNTTYEEELTRLFVRIAEAVNRLSEAWPGSKENFGVYVVTDHGACSILEEDKKSFDSEVVNKLFPEEKYRFSAVGEEEACNIPDNLWAFGLRFRRPFLSDERVYFIPKGHNTVRLPGKANGYLHGGATPEEVVVPMAVYGLVKTAWKTPSARFLNLKIEKETGRAKFYIQRVTSLEIEIQNPNTVDMRILRASIQLPETDVKGCETPRVPGGGVGILRIDCYFKKASLEKRSLEIEIAYEIAGDEYTTSLALESEFKSAVSSGFNLKDL